MCNQPDRHLNSFSFFSSINNVLVNILLIKSLCISLTVFLGSVPGGTAGSKHLQIFKASDSYCQITLKDSPAVNGRNCSLGFCQSRLQSLTRKKKQSAFVTGEKAYYCFNLCFFVYKLSKTSIPLLIVYFIFCEYSLPVI